MNEYKSEGTNIDFEDMSNDELTEVSTRILQNSIYGPDFGADFKELPIAHSYYPTRLEYFAGKALQGLVTGQAEKNLRTTVKRALELAQDMEVALDNL